jgi:hypothetical protein
MHREEFTVNFIFCQMPNLDIEPRILHKFCLMQHIMMPFPSHAVCRKLLHELLSMTNFQLNQPQLNQQPLKGRTRIHYQINVDDDASRLCKFAA